MLTLTYKRLSWGFCGLKKNKGKKEKTMKTEVLMVSSYYFPIKSKYYVNESRDYAHVIRGPQ